MGGSGKTHFEGESSMISPTSNTSRDTYVLQNSAITQIKPKDIEEEDYIYAVPCDPRQTISLRDSVKLNRASPKTIAKQNKNRSAQIINAVFVNVFCFFKKGKIKAKRIQRNKNNTLTEFT